MAERGTRLVPQRQRAGRAQAGGGKPQLRRARADAWTQAQERAFLETLAETCNASEAARVAGKCRAGAYRRRGVDAAFAKAWDEALDMGYAEIELMLMRAALFGTEAEEVTTDADGAVKARKVKRAPSLTVALRLFLCHREKVAKIRAGREAARAQAERPDSAEAIALVDAVMGAVARRRAAAEGDGGAAAP
jgi:hypothetical protein